MRNVLRVFLQQQIHVISRNKTHIHIQRLELRVPCASQVRAVHTMAANQEATGIMEKVKNLALGGLSSAMCADR
jgi:hypothetical protein